MLESSRARINAELSAEALVLDVGGWASPLARADWVLDLMPYETRGLYGEPDPDPERFSAETWIVRDICDRQQWPFDNDQFDFAVCSHTLEDVRDPVWVSAELNRVAKAGYIEVPSRLEEQSLDVQGPWVGWSHHHWLIDVSDDALDFVLKPHMLSGRAEFHFPAEFGAALGPLERVQTLFWRGAFRYRERIFYEPAEADAYLADFVAAHLPRIGDPSGSRWAWLRRLRRRRLTRTSP